MAAMVTFDAEAARKSHEALLGNLRAHRDGLLAELNKAEREIVGVEKLTMFFANMEEKTKGQQPQQADGGELEPDVA